MSPTIRANCAASRTTIYALVGGLVFFAMTAAGHAQQLPLAPTGDLYAGWSLLESLDVSNLNAITLKESRNTHGEGLTFDAAGNLYVGVDGLDVYDTHFNIIGHADAPPTPSARSFFVALRRPGQLFACNPMTPVARLFVFDTTDLHNPALTNTVDIPFTDVFSGQCRSLAFDSSDHLWVASYVSLIKLTLDQAGNPIAAERFYQEAGNPFGLAFQPSTGLLFYSGVNSNFVAAVDPVNPSVVRGMITNVCDNASNSPTSIAFSSSGNMFAGCSNDNSATTDIVAFPATQLVSITGVQDASALAPVKVLLDLSPIEFLAFKPASGPLYHLCLLYDPFKIAKSGSTIPIKLHLCDGSGANLSSPGIVLHAISIKKVSNGISGTVEDSGNANPDGDFRYDGGLGPSGGYIFNLSTKGLAGGTYDLSFTAGGDPSIYKVQFQVKT